MGIENLLNFIQPALKPKHISQYRGKRAAVDVAAWLYKGCFSCAQDLNQNIKTQQYLRYVSKMINLLQTFDIKPILIFDGRKLKAKERTDKIRNQLKKDNLVKAKKMFNEGNSEANKFFQRCLRITKQMLYTTIDFLDKMKIEYIVSPYEADSQISYLCRVGYCDLAITEDSDLICFQCPLILFKLQPDGNCQELQLQKLRDSKQFRLDTIGEKEGDLRVFFSFKDDSLIDACVMSGCDYLPSIKGIGIKKAVKLIHEQGGLTHAVAKLKQTIVLRDKVPNQYDNIVSTIRMIFKFQTVYDPFEKKQIQLNEEEYQKLISSIENGNPLDEPEDKNKWKMKPSAIQQIVGMKMDESIQELFSQGLLDLKSLEPRTREDVDFSRLLYLFRQERETPSYTNNFVPESFSQEDLSITPQKPKYIPPPLNSSSEPGYFDFQSTQLKSDDNIEEMDNFMDICNDLLEEFENSNKTDNLIQDEKLIDNTKNFTQTQDQSEIKKSANPFIHQIKQDNKFHNLSNIKHEDLYTHTHQSEVIEKQKFNVFGLNQSPQLNVQSGQKEITPKKKVNIFGIKQSSQQIEQVEKVKELPSSIKQGKLQQFFVTK